MTRKFGFTGKTIPIQTHTRFRNITFSFLLLICSIVALYSIYPYFLADLLVANEQTIESYTRALAHDKENAELWWVRGRLHHYSLERENLPAAIQDYKQALSLNPRLGQAWADLADCLERQGKDAEAEESIQNALKVWTYSPIVHWQTGNYYGTHGNLEKMYRHFRTAIEYDSSKLDIALNVAWRMEPDPSKILSHLVPDKAATNLSALAFFIDNDELRLAGNAWSRLMQNPLPENPRLDGSVAFPYMDALLSGNRIPDAYRVWMESLEKFDQHRRTPQHRISSKTNFLPDPQGNLVWNGSFENEILDGGFDWRRQQTEGVVIQIDNAIHAEGRRSLRIAFHGVNVHFSHLSQILPTLSAGTYHLQYRLRTENLTTDQRPYFMIERFPGPQTILLQTDFFPSVSEWKGYSFLFKVDPGTQAIRLSLRRSSSEKFDSRIRGSLWLDGVSIRSEKQTFAQVKKSIHDPSEN